MLAQGGALRDSRRGGRRPLLAASLALLLGLACSGGAAPAANPAATARPAGGAPAPTAGAAAPVANASATAPAASTTRKTLQVGVLPTIGSSPFIIGQARGYYAEEGLDLQQVNMASGAETVPPLANGQLDAVSVAPSAGLANAIARGLPVKIVGSNGTIRKGRNIANIIVRRDLAPDGQIVDLSTLQRPIRAGATVEGILPHAVLLLSMERAGVPFDDVQMNFLPLPDINVALANGSLDLANSGEPLITVAEQQGIITRWREMADLYPNLPYGVLMYGVNLLERDRDAGERLMRGYLRANRDYEDAFTRGKDRDAIIAMLAEPLRMTPGLFDTLQERGGLAYLDPNGVVDMSTFVPIVDLWTHTRLLQPGFDPRRMADNSFAEAAVARLGRYE